MVSDVIPVGTVKPDAHVASNVSTTVPFERVVEVELEHVPAVVALAEPVAIVKTEAMRKSGVTRRATNVATRLH
jgi:hypothetical protein